MNTAAVRQIVRSLLFVALVAGLAPLAGPAIAADDVPHIWVYSGTQNYRHASIDHSKEVIAQLAADTGAFTVEFTEDPAALTAEMLARTDITLWLSPSGVAQPDSSEVAPFDDGQRQAFIDWISCGGGYVGVHQAADSYDDWPEWNELVGARFNGHPSSSAFTNFAFGDSQPRAILNNVDDTHASTEPWRGEDVFLFADEYYRWLSGDTPDNLTTDYQPVITFDRYVDPLKELQDGGGFPAGHPLAWASTFRGLNRSFYTNLGHDTGSWDIPEFQDHLLGGIAFVAEQQPDAACLAN